MVGCKPVDQIHTGQWSKPWPELTSVSFLLSSSQPIFTSACLACSCGHKNRYSQSSDTITTATTKSLHAFATLGSKVCFTVTETGFRCEVSINNVKKIKVLDTVEDGTFIKPQWPTHLPQLFSLLLDLFVEWGDHPVVLLQWAIMLMLLWGQL